MGLKEVLMERDGMTSEEADEEIEDAREELLDLIAYGESPMDYCEERWGLEPDYLDELMN